MPGSHNPRLYQLFQARRRRRYAAKALTFLKPGNGGIKRNLVQPGTKFGFGAKVFVAFPGLQYNFLVKVLAVFRVIGIHKTYLKNHPLIFADEACKNGMLLLLVQFLRYMYKDRAICYIMKNKNSFNF